MNQYQQIRMSYEQQHKSIRWIARELHCSRDTVRKYIGEAMLIDWAAPRPTSGATGWTSATSVCANAPPVPCSSWHSCGRTRSPSWKPFRLALSSSAVRPGGSSLTTQRWVLRKASASTPRSRIAMRSWRPTTPSAPTSAIPQRATRRDWWRNWWNMPGTIFLCRCQKWMPCRS